MTREEKIELVKGFNECKTDRQRYLFIQKNNKYFKVILDNDNTWAEFTENELDENDEPVFILSDFDEFTGDDDGIFTLFELLGIEAEGC